MDTKSKPAAQNVPSKASWLEKAAALAVMRQDRETTKTTDWKSPIAVINGYTPIKIQEAILLRTEVGLRAGVAISSRDPNIVKSLTRDPSPIVRIALLETNPLIKVQDIVMMHSLAMQRGEADVQQAARDAMNRVELSMLREEKRAVPLPLP